MPRTPSAPAPPPDEAATVVCAATYYADLRNRYAFTFLVPATNTRFAIYTAHPDRYEIGVTYALILAAPEAVPVPLSVEDLEFLRHCLANTAQRWQAAITEARAGAERPKRAPAGEPPPGCINVEPTPAGYRAAVRLLRDELTRVEQLRALLGEVLAAAQTQQGEGP